MILLSNLCTELWPFSTLLVWLDTVERPTRWRLELVVAVVTSAGTAARVRVTYWGAAEAAERTAAAKNRV